jgi:hypothetical protein
VEVDIITVSSGTNKGMFGSLDIYLWLSTFAGRPAEPFGGLES